MRHLLCGSSNYKSEQIVNEWMNEWMSEIYFCVLSKGWRTLSGLKHTIQVTVTRINMVINLKYTDSIYVNVNSYAQKPINMHYVTSLYWSEIWNAVLHIKQTNNQKKKNETQKGQQS